MYLTLFIYSLAICASISCCYWPGSNQHYRLFSVQSNIPHPWPQSTKLGFLYLIILFLCLRVCVFLHILYSSKLFLVELSVGFPLQEARWGCGMPSISPGSIGNSRSLLLGKSPDMNLLLRQRLSHCFQLWLLLRSSVQSIICVSGGQRNTRQYVWRMIYMCCTCINKYIFKNPRKNIIFLFLFIVIRETGKQGNQLLCRLHWLLAISWHAVYMKIHLSFSHHGIKYIHRGTFLSDFRRSRAFIQAPPFKNKIHKHLIFLYVRTTDTSR